MGIAPPTGLGNGPNVHRVVYDSRSAGPGSLFVAVPGGHADGHDFAAEAVRRGAVAVIAERRPRGLPSRLPVVVVPNSRRTLSALAAALAGYPSRELTVVGITGTDGKTTTATLLWAAWRAAGIRAGSLTTIDFRSGDAVTPNLTRQTTLEAVEVHEQLRSMRDAGCTSVALETSSHSLELHRVADVDYRAAVYTRITSEHLELHGTRDRYLAAKRRLLERVSTRGDGIAVLDRDDEYAFPSLSRVPVDRRLTYSAGGRYGADLVAQELSGGPEGIRFVAATPWGRAHIALRLAGRFNAANALAALGAACATGTALETAVAGLESLERVGGRMELVDLGQPFTVIIDYAHSAEALQAVLTELRGTTVGRLWAVFGSAGERDRGKRAIMGALAARLSDLIVLTDEDPREESRDAILEEIAGGAGGRRRGETLFLIPDREAAIGFAIAMAERGDAVLLAGKGHETSMIFGRERRAWEERAVAERALRERRRSAPPELTW
ncbi:MAG: UDP-N-acetylmuramoyl-L-alanyl-D-glutamate--2,6-diaminopimelate ligase [Candidatus Dormibacteria bacterium]